MGTTQVPYSDAKSYCEDNGGSLVAIEDETKYNHVYHYAQHYTNQFAFDFDNNIFVVWGAIWTGMYAKQSDVSFSVLI